MKKPFNFRDAVKIELMMITVREGEGTTEDVSRLVDYYVDFSGKIVFKHDPLNIQDNENSKTD